MEEETSLSLTGLAKESWLHLLVKVSSGMYFSFYIYAPTSSLCYNNLINCILFICLWIHLGACLIQLFIIFLKTSWCVTKGDCVPMVKVSGFQSGRSQMNKGLKWKQKKTCVVLVSQMTNFAYIKLWIDWRKTK